MTLFPNAVAETAELEAALEGLTPQEAAAGGAIVGVAVGLFIAAAIVWYIFQAIADWKIFAKAGEPGWKSLIPIYNVIVEFRLCWSSSMGAVYIVSAFCANLLAFGENVANWRMIIAGILVVVMVVLYIMQSLKLARAFGKGTGFGICLLLFGPIARLVLGFGSARYVGNPDK